MMADNKDRILHGEDGDPFLVNLIERRCAGDCNKVLPLKWFYPIQTEDGVQVTLFCKVCLPQYTKDQVDKEKHILSIARVKAIREMGDSLKKILQKPVTKEEGPSIVELATRTIQAVEDPVTLTRGQEAFANMISREVGQVYEDPAPCIRTRVLRHKWAGLIIDMQALVAKVKAEETKVADLNDEQLAALLEFASKQAVLENEEIRAALLEDPEVRAAFLKDINMQLIEAKAVHQEQA